MIFVQIVGFLFKYINRQLTFILIVTAYGISTALLPMSPSFWFMYLFGLIEGIGAGVIDVVKTVWLIEMWDSKSGSLLQLSEFGYGLGITIGPLVVGPFLVGQSVCFVLKNLFLIYQLKTKYYYPCYCLYYFVVYFVVY